MSQRFEYGYGQVKDLGTRKSTDQRGRTTVEAVVIDGEPLKPGKRFWTSLHARFGFSANIFRYFSHEEVFARISTAAPNDHIRWGIERDESGTGRLLAVTNPAAPLIHHDDLVGLLRDYRADSISYHNGVVRSVHAPRAGGFFDVAGDKFQNKFVLDTPIDGYGRPSIYLSLLRQVCSNGAIGYARTFRSELALGRGEDGVRYALVRGLDGFNNEDGYGALRQRFESAARSWASVHEANRLYRTLARVHADGLAGPASQVGGDGAREPLLHGFHKMTGDLNRLYGLANLDALSVKRQRTLPTACKVYDLLNLASEVATHHATPSGGRVLQAFIGELVSGEYDLEGTADHFDDFRDFFIGNEATTETLAGLHRRGA